MCLLGWGRGHHLAHGREERPCRSYLQLHHRISLKTSGLRFQYSLVIARGFCGLEFGLGTGVRLVSTLLPAAPAGRRQGCGPPARTLTGDIFACPAFLLTRWLASKGTCSERERGRGWIALYGFHLEPCSTSFTEFLAYQSLPGFVGF